MNDAEDGNEFYSWEKEYQRSWEHIPEDQELLEKYIDEERIRKRREKFISREAEGVVRRRMTRYLFVLMDFSDNMKRSDERPMRSTVLIQAVEAFVREYYDQNPISQMGIIIIKNSVAEKITELSGNPTRHIQALKSVEAAGRPSLYNGIEAALASLKTAPRYGSREIIIVYGSLNTCDPGDIFELADKCAQEGVRISAVGLGAHMHVLKTITQKTNGTYKIGQDPMHFKELLSDLCPPPAEIKRKGMQASLIRMGFPLKVSGSTPVLCACHQTLQLVSFVCPRCSSHICELPTQCVVCGLVLVSSPHLARSYHHLFPVAVYEEIKKAENNEQNEMEVEKLMIQSDRKCFSCVTDIAIEKSLYTCPKCKKNFCGECDQYIHESLHNCIGCECNL